MAFDSEIAAAPYGSRSSARRAPPSRSGRRDHDRARRDRRQPTRHRIQAATPDPGRTMPARTQEQGSTRRRVSALLLATSEARGLVDPPLVVTVGPKHPLFFGGVYEPRVPARGIAAPLSRGERSLAQDRLRPELQRLGRLAMTSSPRRAPHAAPPISGRRGASRPPRGNRASRCWSPTTTLDADLQTGRSSPKPCNNTCHKMGKFSLIQPHLNQKSPAKRQVANPFEAAHNPKVAGSNPAPAIRTACRSWAFLVRRFGARNGRVTHFLFCTPIHLGRAAAGNVAANNCFR